MKNLIKGLATLTAIVMVIFFMTLLFFFYIDVILGFFNTLTFKELNKTVIILGKLSFSLIFTTIALWTINEVRVHKLSNNEHLMCNHILEGEYNNITGKWWLTQNKASGMYALHHDRLGVVQDCITPKQVSDINIMSVKKQSVGVIQRP